MTQQATEETIAHRAYEIYEQRGKTKGYSLDDWLTAEREVTGSPLNPGERNKKAAGTNTEPPPDIDIEKRNSVRQKEPLKKAPVQKKGRSGTKSKKKTTRAKRTPKPDIK